MPRNPGQALPCMAADIQRLNAFLRRSICQGFCPRDFTDIKDIFDAADEALFTKIHPNHLLAPLLPKEVLRPTPYHLRPRRHGLIGNLLQKSTS